MSRDRIIRISRHKQHSRAWIQATEFLNENGTAHVRHYKIRNNQPKRISMLLTNFQCVIPVTGGERSITGILKNRTDELAYG